MRLTDRQSQTLAVLPWSFGYGRNQKLEPRDTPVAALDTPTDLPTAAVRDITKALKGILADSFALYLKTKNFHWHVSGPHFRSYHLLLDDQAADILAATDPLAERIRKIGGATLRSIGDITRHQSLKDNDEAFVPPTDMLKKLVADNKLVVGAMRKAHGICDEHGDIGSAALLEEYIDHAEKRVWFLFEASRKADSSGH